MKDLMTLIRPEMNIVNKTLDFVKKQLSGIDFAVTGSYANDILNGLNTFNKSSDLDIAVEEKYVKMVANMLLTLPDYNSIEKINDYGGGGGGGPYYNIRQSTEYMLKGNLIPVHIIGSYTNKQKNEAVNLNGTKYLEPILPKDLRLAA